GALDTATAVNRLMDDGYNETDATILAKSGVGQKLTQHTANITTSIVDAYENWLMPRSEAETMIESMGYDKQEADFILQGAAFRQVAKIVTQAVSNLHTRYIGHKISASEVSNDLDALGIPAQQRDTLLHMWLMEHDANVKTLTEAQVVKAAGLQLITADDATTRLVAMGYSETDAGLLLSGA
ncbi:MAG TPA: hypothetical protein VGR71_05115, partial [Nitrospira sp.]|nr:hypothetical protein [Nitrospira sp.]